MDSAKKEKKLAKKKAKLSPHVRRHLALLDKYYPVDYDNRTITFSVHYEKVSQLIDSRLGESRHPFREDALEAIYATVNTFPLDFRIDLRLIIDDYEGMDPNSLLELFHDDMQFNYFAGRRELIKKWMSFSLLLLSGVLMFFFVIYGSAKKWYSSESTEIVQKVLDTLGTLFIWEGATIIFLDPLRGVQTLAKLLARTRTVSIYGQSEQNLLAQEDCKEIVRAWRGGSAFARFSSLALLAAACFLIGDAVTSFTHSLTTCILGGGGTSLVINTVVIGIIAAIKLAAGLSAVLLFNGRSSMSSVVKVFGWFLASVQVALLTLELVYLFSSWNWETFFNSFFSLFFSLLFSIFYLVGYYMDRKEL